MSEETIWEGRSQTLIPEMGKTHYKITTERIVVRTGRLRTSEEDIELYRLKDISVNQTLLQKAQNIGDIKITSTDVSHKEMVLEKVPDPFDLKEKIREAANEMRDKKNISIREEQ